MAKKGNRKSKPLTGPAQIETDFCSMPHRHVKPMNTVLKHMTTHNQKLHDVHDRTYEHAAQGAGGEVRNTSRDYMQNRSVCTSRSAFSTSYRTCFQIFNLQKYSFKLISKNEYQNTRYIRFTTSLNRALHHNYCRSHYSNGLQI